MRVTIGEMLMFELNIINSMSAEELWLHRENTNHSYLKTTDEPRQLFIVGDHYRVIIFVLFSFIGGDACRHYQANFRHYSARGRQSEKTTRQQCRLMSLYHHTVSFILSLIYLAVRSKIQRIIWGYAERATSLREELHPIALLFHFIDMAIMRREHNEERCSIASREIG